MAKRSQERVEAVYDKMVFQGSSVVTCEEDLGILQLQVNNGSFSVIINNSNAEYLIDQLRDFLKGRAPHILKDDN